MPSAGRGSTGRPTMILAFVMVGWLFLTMALAAFGGVSGAAHSTPATIDRGVVVTPADGWTSGTDVWNVGPGGVSFKRAGAVAVFVADTYSGTAADLLQFQIEEFQNGFESFRQLPTADTTVAENVPAVKALFSGTSRNGEIEGEMVAASRQGTGVVMVAIAPFGQLRNVQDDVDEMLRTLVIP